ncbi:MAG: ABC transporter permease [Actinomycetota bacterium]|nr:ABC transporter permease [Actinomycetota bacterium]
MVIDTRTVGVAWTGSTGILRGELVRWFGARGLFHLVFWLLMIDGWLYFTVMTKHIPFGGLGFQSLMTMLLLFVPLAAIVLTEASVIGEYRSGVASWTVSKPVPRWGYVAAKLVGLWVGLSATAVFIPGVVAYWWLPKVEPYRFVTPEAPPLGRFLVALSIVSFVVAFFIALTALLGTSIRRRGVVALIALFSYAVIRNPPRELWTGWDTHTPSGLIGDLLGSWSTVVGYVYGDPLGATSAVVWTIGVSLAFATGAVLVYQRLEL